MKDGLKLNQIFILLIVLVLIVGGVYFFLFKKNTVEKKVDNELISFPSPVVVTSTVVTSTIDKLENKSGESFVTSSDKNLLENNLMDKNEKPIGFPINNDLEPYSLIKESDFKKSSWRWLDFFGNKVLHLYNLPPNTKIYMPFDGEAYFSKYPIGNFNAMSVGLYNNKNYYIYLIGSLNFKISFSDNTYATKVKKGTVVAEVTQPLSDIQLIIVIFNSYERKTDLNYYFKVFPAIR